MRFTLTGIGDLCTLATDGAQQGTGRKPMKPMTQMQAKGKKNQKNQTSLSKTVYNALRATDPLTIFATLEEVNVLFLAQLSPEAAKGWQKQSVQSFCEFIAPVLGLEFK